MRDGVDDTFLNHKKASLYSIIENQKMFYDCGLVDLVWSVFPNLLAWNLVSIQPLLSPSEDVRYITRADSDTMSTTFHRVHAFTRRMKKIEFDEFNYFNFTQAVIDDIDTEILTDLYNNAGVVSGVNLAIHKNVYDKLAAIKHQFNDLISFHTEKFYNIKPNWIVVNDDVYLKYGGIFKEYSSQKKIQLYINQGVPSVLIGYKDGIYDSGYVYSPYVPFTFTPTLDNKRGLLTRYGKRLFPHGSLYYSKLVLLGDEEENGQKT